MSDSLSVSDLHKSYPTPAEPLVVLRGITLSIAPGEALAIVGPSGSGKSTLLNILGTLDRPTSGTVRLGQVDPFALSARELSRFRSERIGFVFQDHHLLPQCTALENVLVARLAAGKVRTEDVQRGRDLLARVGLTQRLDHLPAELSGGERQRVAIARGLMNRPGLLLCDEPTGNLDSRNSAAIGQLLRAVASENESMLIVVTHSADLAASLPRQLRMQDGQLV